MEIKRKKWQFLIQDDFSEKAYLELCFWSAEEGHSKESEN